MRLKPRYVMCHQYDYSLLDIFFQVDGDKERGVQTQFCSKEFNRNPKYPRSVKVHVP